VKISEVSGERVDNKTKLDVLKQEEAAIKAERAAAAKAKQDDIAKKAAAEEVVAKKAAQEEEVAKAKVGKGNYRRES
jgi:colicin import membrane protein